MATVKKKSAAAPKPRPAKKQGTIKKAPGKKSSSTSTSAGRRRDMPAVTWATPLGDLTLNDLVNVGILDSETSKVDPPENLRVVLSDSDIAKIVAALRTAAE